MTVVSGIGLVLKAVHHFDIMDRKQYRWTALSAKSKSGLDQLPQRMELKSAKSEWIKVLCLLV